MGAQGLTQAGRLQEMWDSQFWRNRRTEGISRNMVTKEVQRREKLRYAVEGFGGYSRALWGVEGWENGLVVSLWKHPSC